MVGGLLSQIFKSLLFGWILSFGSKKMQFLSARTNRKDLEFLAKLLDKGAIKPVIDRRYPLDRAAEAMDYIKQGHSSGKVVINIIPE
jgi:NADPH:quinone reductase-like Zn-dependent oxidoreductase